jgi:hypothetical protein
MSILGYVLEEEDAQGVVFREATTAERGWFRSKPGFVTVTLEQLHFDPEMTQGMGFGTVDPYLQIVLSVVTFGYWARRSNFQRATWYVSANFEEVERFEVRRRRVRVWISGRETRFVLSKHAEFIEAVTRCVFAKTGRTLSNQS